MLVYRNSIKPIKSCTYKIQLRRTGTGYNTIEAYRDKIHIRYLERRFSILADKERI